MKIEKEEFNKKNKKETFQNKENKIHKLEGEFIEFRKNFRLHHKIIYASLAFLSAVMVWYGIYEIISELPYLKEGIVSLLIGVLIMTIIGAHYNKVTNKITKT